MYAILVFILALVLGIYLARRGVNIRITIKHEYDKEPIPEVDDFEEKQQDMARSVSRVMQNIMGVNADE